MRVLLFGLGYVGSRLAAELAGRGHEVFGVQRTAATVPRVTTIVADVADPKSLQRLPRDWDWVVNTVSSSKGGPEQYRAVYLDGNRHLVDWLRVQKYIYTSSTSVYGQVDGSLVDEENVAQGSSPTSKILVEAEHLLLHAAQDRGFPAVVLRVSGIYGPGRGHLFQQYLKGEATIPGRGERMINMVHVEDVVGAILTALERGQPGQVYNVTDNEPVSYLDYFTWLSNAMKRPIPPFSSEENVTRKRGLTNKRVSNVKLRSLGYALKYPTFREGYAPEIQAAST